MKRRAFRSRSTPRKKQARRSGPRAKTTDATKSRRQDGHPEGAPSSLGTFTECKQRSKEEKESALGIVFDKAVLKEWRKKFRLNVQHPPPLFSGQQVGSVELCRRQTICLPGGAAVGSARAKRRVGALGGVRLDGWRRNWCSDQLPRLIAGGVAGGRQSTLQ